MGFYWVNRPPSNTWFLGSIRVSLQTAFRSVQPFLQGSRTWPSDRHTDNHARFVAIVRFLCSARCDAAYKLRRLYSVCLRTRVTSCVRYGLQERTEELQQTNEALERSLSDVVTENRHLREPLALANNEVAEMRTKTDDYDNMKSLLQVRSLVLVFLTRLPSC